MIDAMSSLFEVRRLLSHGGARVIGIVQTMCHVIINVTANHRLEVTGQLADKPTRRQPTRQQTNSSKLKLSPKSI